MSDEEIDVLSSDDEDLDLGFDDELQEQPKIISNGPKLILEDEKDNTIENILKVDDELGFEIDKKINMSSVEKKRGELIDKSNESVSILAKRKISEDIKEKDEGVGEEVVEPNRRRERFTSEREQEEIMRESHIEREKKKPKTTPKER